MPGEIIVHMDSGKQSSSAWSLAAASTGATSIQARPPQTGVGAVLNQRRVATTSVPIVAHRLPSRMRPSKIWGDPGGSAILRCAR